MRYRGYMLLFLCSNVEAQVSPLSLASIVIFALAVTKMPIECFQLIYNYLYGDKFVDSFSICLTQWKCLGLFVEDHGLWMWLWGKGLVSDMGCNYRNGLLCGCFGTIFSQIYVFFCWNRLWYWFPFRSRCGRFINTLLLLKGDCLLEYLIWQIWIRSYFTYIWFLRLLCSGLFCNFHGR